MKLLNTPVLLLTTSVLLSPVSNAKSNSEQFDRQLQQFAQSMSDKHGLDIKELSQLFSEIEHKQSIIDAITRPAEGKKWHEYRPIFVNDKRIQGGVKFWKENEALLNRANEAFGVPPEIITAIIGVETQYGGYTGRYRVMDALSTLAFDYPKRAPFFRRQLEEFLLLVKEENLPADKLVGSYAGAMGMPQFIPSSYRTHAVDFDNDGSRDLLTNNADVIGSVAAYFKNHGWQPGGPITEKVTGVTSDHEPYIAAGMKPSLSVAELQDAGIDISPELSGEALTSLIKLDTQSGVEHWLGLNNFYVITRYNHSNLYSMAVYQLSQEILKRREQN